MIVNIKIDNLVQKISRNSMNDTLYVKLNDILSKQYGNDVRYFYNVNVLDISSSQCINEDSTKFTLRINIIPIQHLVLAFEEMEERLKIGL